MQYILETEKHPIVGNVNYENKGWGQLFSKGKFIKKREKIADMGTFEENGGWPPHLHFQIIKDMEGYLGDYPGVAKKSELDHYKNNCPDPMIIFN